MLHILHSHLLTYNTQASVPVKPRGISPWQLETMDRSAFPFQQMGSWLLVLSVVGCGTLTCGSMRFGSIRLPLGYKWLPIESNNHLHSYLSIQQLIFFNSSTPLNQAQLSLPVNLSNIQCNWAPGLSMMQLCSFNNSNQALLMSDDVFRNNFLVQIIPPSNLGILEGVKGGGEGEEIAHSHSI